MQARHELVAAIAERYRAAGPGDKSGLLDELVSVTGWLRKHGIRALSKATRDRGETVGIVRRRRSRRYGSAIEDALSALWEASDRLCGKRLKVMIPTLLPNLERHGRLTLKPDDRAAVLAVSAATIDRMLASMKKAANGGKRRRAGFSSAVRREVPIRTFNDWDGVVPGFCEADMVARGGADVAGTFIQTLTFVDVVTGWTVCLPLVVRDGTLVVSAIEKMKTLLPWQLRGLDFDNDSAFMNDVVVPWCRSQSIEVTRSRAYKKNDQAFVEQQNGAMVRRLVGYGRFEGIDTAGILARLFAAACLLANYFQPSFKLKSKRREGAMMIKKYFDPATPYARALAHPTIDATTKEKLRATYATLDPVALLGEVRAAQEELGHRIDRRAGATSKAEIAPAPTVSEFARKLGSDGELGEQRKIHRRAYVRRKPVPRRPSILDPYVTTIEEWLGEEAHLSALTILARLRNRLGAPFTTQHTRTLQRFLHSYRRKAARRLLDTAATEITPPLVAARSSADTADLQALSAGNMIT